MRLRGIQFDDVYLVFGERDFDLHNEYGFAGFFYDIAKRQLVLRWKVLKEAWVRAGQPETVALVISGVSHLEALPRAPEMPFTEDECLEGVSLVEPGMDVETASFAAQRETSDAILDDFRYVFHFQSGFALIVQADEATCETA